MYVGTIPWAREWGQENKLGGHSDRSGESEAGTENRPGCG